MSSLHSPVIFVEDDAEDHEFMLEAYKSLNMKNGWHLFSRAHDAYNYLLTTHETPLIIISEVRLRGMDGIDLRQRILDNDYLRKKSIPFVYLTTSADKKDVEAAYELQVQGYFVKKNTIPEISRMLQKVIDYWKESRHPNNAQ